jgi:hypothetical protein
VVGTQGFYIDVTPTPQQCSRELPIAFAVLEVSGPDVPNLMLGLGRGFLARLVVVYSSTSVATSLTHASIFGCPSGESPSRATPYILYTAEDRTCNRRGVYAVRGVPAGVRWIR